MSEEELNEKLPLIINTKVLNDAKNIEKMYKGIANESMSIILSFINKYNIGTDDNPYVLQLFNMKLTTIDWAELKEYVLNEASQMDKQSKNIIKRNVAYNKKTRRDALMLSLLVAHLKIADRVISKLTDDIKYNMKQSAKVYNEYLDSNKYNNVNSIFKNNILWSGNSFENRIRDNVVKLSNDIVSNSIIRYNIKRSINDIKSFVIPKSKRFAKNNASSITTSENTALIAATALYVFNRNKIDKVRFKTQENESVCSICRPMNNKVFATKKAPQLPLHPRGLCYYIPLK